MTTAKTRQEAAAEALREAIVDGAYAPGRRLRQQELAKEFGCSAIPIREALQRLAAEGFVVLDPQRGARVAAFDGRMLEEVFEVRIALEQIAVRRAATRMTRAIAERTRRILERMERPALTPAEWVHLDWEFHDSLCATAEQEFLRKMISNLRRQMEPYLRLDLTKVGTITLGRLEHRRIFQACRRRDEDAAAHHMIAHLQRTVRGFVEYIRRHAREPEAVSGPSDAAASKDSRPRA
jgi:DNA-binding GntR family transcriptional regulator